MIEQEELIDSVLEELTDKFGEEYYDYFYDVLNELWDQAQANYIRERRIDSDDLVTTEHEYYEQN